MFFFHFLSIEKISLVYILNIYLNILRNEKVGKKTPSNSKVDYFSLELTYLTHKNTNVNPTIQFCWHKKISAAVSLWGNILKRKKKKEKKEDENRQRIGTLMQQGFTCLCDPGSWKLLTHIHTCTLLLGRSCTVGLSKLRLLKTKKNLKSANFLWVGLHVRVTESISHKAQ